MAGGESDRRVRCRHQAAAGHDAARTVAVAHAEMRECQPGMHVFMYPYWYTCIHMSILVFVFVVVGF